ncbi:MAG: hypothetical protein M1268_01560 [Patescibacteria group bacterium]|nr:hypothetical protein [Patescibacteria group bacterium]
MTKNPFINAAVALLYITVIASVMFFGTKNTGPVNSVIVPIAVVSLFTLSAAVMGYLFSINHSSFILKAKRKLPSIFFLKLSLFLP